MNFLEFARLVTEVCALSLPPGVTPERLYAIGEVESRHQPVVVSAANSNGTRDFGRMQINTSNFGRYGVTARTILEPCTNIRVGAAILAEMDVYAYCGYNAGPASRRCAHPDGSRGYPARVLAALSRLTPVAAAAPPPSPPSARPVRRPIPAASVYARRRSSARQFVYLSER